MMLEHFIFEREGPMALMLSLTSQYHLDEGV